jgi:Rod binding domain-containing protein
MRVGDASPVLPELAAGAPGVLAASGPDEARLEAARRAADRGDADETARQFEKLFAVLLVRELRRCMPDGPFGQGPGADVYEGWFDEHLGGALADRDALGLAGMIKTSIQRTQAAREAASGAEGTSELARPIHEPSAATSRLAASAALRSLRGLSDLSEVASAALGRESLHLQPFATFRSRPHE